MEDLNQASWVDKVLVTLLLLLRDWLMLLPLSSPSPSTHTQTATIRTVFEVRATTRCGGTGHDVGVWCGAYPIDGKTGGVVWYPMDNKMWGCGVGRTLWVVVFGTAPF